MSRIPPGVSQSETAGSDRDGLISDQESSGLSSKKVNSSHFYPMKNVHVELELGP